jgi:hypothetical protein
MTKTEAEFIIAYLLFSFSGFVAVVKFFTNPHVKELCGVYRTEAGLDLSWCEVILIAVISLLPVLQISGNLFWFWVFRQHIKRRPLINWPCIKFPRWNLPKCPIAIRGKAPK